MIEEMIRLNILKEERIDLKKRSTKRLFVIGKYDWNIFPKVRVSIVQKKECSEKKINFIKCDQNPTKSRLQVFLSNKSLLDINLQRREEERLAKSQLQRKLQEENNKKVEQEKKKVKQQQQRENKRRELKELQLKKIQQDKQNTLSQMNNFWLKQRDKLIEFICPETDISMIDSPCQQIKKPLNSLDVSSNGHILHMEIKDLKIKEQLRKNPIQPIVPWSFVKKALENEEKEQKNTSKQQKQPSKKIEQQPFANHPTQSMFASSYYGWVIDSETLTNKKGNDEKTKKCDNDNCFSFKRNNTASEPQDFLTSTKLPYRVSSFRLDVQSQTLTVPQPTTKNKKIGTGDLQFDSRQAELKPKRDPFVEELISNYWESKRLG